LDTIQTPGSSEIVDLSFDPEEFSTMDYINPDQIDLVKLASDLAGIFDEDDITVPM
jgi:hypothetical protein